MLPRLLIPCLVIFLGSGLSPLEAFAWGQDGHRLVCALAEQQLGPEGRRFVEHVTSLGEYLDGETSSFVEGCLWPDSVKYSDYKGTYENHFINIPAAAEDIDLTRDCAALDCIVAAIQRSLVYLARPADGDREKGRKAAALRFLGHLVADLHQPLHVSHGKDWGGNKIEVSWFGEASNLHRVWDHGILERAGIEYSRSLRYLKSRPDDATGTDILAWTRETLALARQKAYLGPGGRKVASGDRLGRPYFEHAKPVAIQQLGKAGSRLARLIDGLATNELEPVILSVEERRRAAQKAPGSAAASPRVALACLVNGKMSASHNATAMNAIAR